MNKSTYAQLTTIRMADLKCAASRVLELIANDDSFNEIVRKLTDAQLGRAEIIVASDNDFEDYEWFIAARDTEKLILQIIAPKLIDTDIAELHKAKELQDIDK